MFAAQNGHEQVARLLIDAGVDLMTRNSDGHTALMISCQNGHDRFTNLITVKAEMLAEQSMAALLMQDEEEKDKPMQGRSKRRRKKEG